MIVVADTSPLNYLILIEHVQILEPLFGRVVIPPAAQAELLSARAPAPVRKWMAAPPAWLDVRSPLPTFRDSTALGAGEADAIALAEQLEADRILIDETLGRREALRRGLKIIGTLGILRDAHKQKLLHLPDAIERLKQTTFRVPPQIIKAMLDAL